MAEIGYSFPTSAVPARFEIFTADGTFTAKEGISTYYITMIGGGGGGGSAIFSGGNAVGGGGGAGDLVVDYPVTINGPIHPPSLEKITITIGQGGASAAAGTATSFGSYLSAAGGEAGQSNTDSLTFNPKRNHSPGNTSGVTIQFSGMGASGLNGRGGAARTTTGVGNAGTGYGSAGSGGYRDSTGTSAGGAGSNGILIVKW